MQLSSFFRRKYPPYLRLIPLQKALLLLPPPVPRTPARGSLINHHQGATFHAVGSRLTCSPIKTEFSSPAPKTQTYQTHRKQAHCRFGYNPRKAGEMAEWLKAAVC